MLKLTGSKAAPSRSFTLLWLNTKSRLSALAGAVTALG